MLSTRSPMRATQYQPVSVRPRCPGATVGRMSFHDITMTSIVGDQVDFSDYEGQLALVVNVASA